MGPHVSSFVVHLEKRLHGEGVGVVAYSIASFDVAVV